MHIQIYDTTLRDGTQGEGVNLSAEDKLKIARRLDDFGVDYIEGGWPGSNPKDMEFFDRAQRELSLTHAKVDSFRLHLPGRHGPGGRPPNSTADSGQYPGGYHLRQDLGHARH